MKKIYCFDIDGTICTITDSKYDDAAPLKGRIAMINRLYSEGHTIKYFTARGSTTGIDWSTDTEKQLSDWGAKYHELHFGKPHYDMYVGDKALNDKVFFGKTIFEEF